MPIGFLLGGMLGELSVDPVTNTANYGQLFALPAAIILVVMIVYCRGTGLWPRSENKETAVEAPSATTVATGELP
jgi:hypothetical protein